jgi:hypothetical protein
MAETDRVLCANCGRVLHDGEHGPPGVLGAEGERNPCPDCGATRRTIEKSLNDVVVVTDVTVTPKVERGYNPERLALLGFMVARAWRSGSASLGRPGSQPFWLSRSCSRSRRPGTS